MLTNNLETSTKNNFTRRKSIKFIKIDQANVSGIQKITTDLKFSRNRKKN